MKGLSIKELQIRQFKADDIAAISEIEHLSFKDPFPSYFLSQLADANPDTFLVAVIRDKIVGYVVIDKWPDQDHLASIAVIPESRMKGVGQAMLDHLIERLDSGSLKLEVRRSNSAALELYRKNGFIQTGVAHSYYPDGEDAIQMQKVLEKPAEILATA